MNEEISFIGHRFPPNKAVLICDRVFAGEAEPEIVVHDFDGWLQCLSSQADKAKTVALSELVNLLPTADELPILNPGQYAVKCLHCWEVHKIEDA